MRANKLCIPESSLRLLLLQEYHGGGLMGHFGRDKTFATLSKNYFGQRCFATSTVSPTDALHVAKLSLKINLMAFTCHFQFHINHRKILAWIFCLVCLELEMSRILFLLLWTDSPKWLISFLATRQTMLHMLPISFVGKSCDFMECQRRLSRTVMSSS